MTKKYIKHMSSWWKMTPKTTLETLERKADSILAQDGSLHLMTEEVRARRPVSLYSPEGHVSGATELRGGYATLEGSRIEPDGIPEDLSMGTKEPESYFC
jgi:hypothetical protein